MNKSNFTKGPWKVLNNLSYSDRKHHFQILTKDAGLWVANTEDCDNEEEEANASLIACSPEMYWMLEKCRTALHDCGMWCLSEDVFKLLKKARGEE